MIKELHLKNWKSFGDTILYIEPVTVLMGLNASGKSNAIEALLFLQRIMTAKDLDAALNGDQYMPEIRGGITGAVKHKENIFSIGVLFEIEGIEYLYEIHCSINKLKCHIKSEKLIENPTKNESVKIFSIENDEIGNNRAMFFDALPSDEVKKIIPMQIRFKNVSMLKLFRDYEINSAKMDKLLAIRYYLENIFILDVQPNRARTYSKIAEKLQENGSNVAGFIAGLPEQQQSEVLAKMLDYAKQLPEKDFTKIFVDKIGRLNNDAMVSVEEDFFEEKRIADAHTLSEGTLRFIIILTAILTRPAHSLLVIDEIDNGIHPSRASLLLEILLKESKERNIDILVTTHNEAFLNVLTPHLLAFVMYVHRDKAGNSIITPVDEIEELPRLLAQGNLGDVVANKKLHHFLNGE